MFGDASTVGSGFLNGTGQADSPQPKSKGQLRRLQSAVPLCIRQIKDHPEEEFKLFGMPTQIITIVAILKEYEVQSTKATYELEDHTGRIKAIFWLENDNDTAPNLPLVKEGCYLRVFGSLRMQEGEKLLMVLRMYSIENLNEITTHLLDVIDVRLQAEALGKGDGLLAKIKKNNPGAELANSMSFMGTDMETSTSNNLKLTSFQEKIYNLLRSNTSAQGIHRSIICKGFPPNLHREVDAALEYIIGEGYAYSTIDNDHFKVTDSM